MQTITAQGKEHAVAIGITKLSTKDMFVTLFVLRFALCLEFDQSTHTIRSIDRLLFGFFGNLLERSKTINKGIGVDNVHWLGDSLWQTKKIEKK